MAALLLLPLGWAAYGLARVDGQLGAPAGPDRLMAEIDGSTAPIEASDVRDARIVLAQRPIEGDAFRVLAQSELQAGRMAEADALYAIAIKRAPRNLWARAYQIDRALGQGDMALGIQHLDALLRVHPRLAGPFAERLLPQLGAPGLLPVLIERLNAGPAWRRVFIGGLLGEGVDPAAGEAFLAGLAEAAPLPADERRVRVELLDRMGRHGEARQLWLASTEGAEEASLIHDGGFELPLDEPGTYGWRMPTAPGVSAGSDTVGAAEGAQALALIFSGRAVTLNGPAQHLALPAGDYRFSFKSDNQTRTSRPFHWQLTCRDARGQPPLARIELPAQAGWKESVIAFTVPEGCGGQLLILQHPARSLMERQISGVLRLDDLRITAEQKPSVRQIEG